MIYAFWHIKPDDIGYAVVSDPHNAPPEWALIEAHDLAEAKLKLIRGELLRPAKTRVYWTY